MSRRDLRLMFGQHNNISHDAGIAAAKLLTIAVVTIVGGWSAVHLETVNLRGVIASVGSTSPWVAVELESGSLNGGTVIASSSTASGGKYIQFGTGSVSPPTPPPPTPTPTPPAPGTYKPDATNTGVPAGTSLQVVNSDITVTTAGTIIDAVDVHGFIFVKANNVTIKRSIVRGRATSSNGALIQIVSGTGTLIQDTEISLTTPVVYLDGIWGSNFTANRLNIHGPVDGMKAGTGDLIEASYIHDMTSFASDPNQGGKPTHNDAIQILSGINITILGNNMVMPNTQNSAIQITQDFGQVKNVTMQQNWADGGGCTFNISHNNGPTPMTQIYLYNNKFGRNSYFSCPILYSLQTQETASGNVYEDNGQPVPISRHN